MKYLNRIYNLYKVGINISEEEREIIMKINSFKNFLESCEQTTCYYGNTFFYKDNIIYLEYSSQLKELYFNKKLGEIYNKELILFVANEFFNFKTNKAISYKKEDSVIFNIFKALYL